MGERSSKAEKLSKTERVILAEGQLSITYYAATAYLCSKQGATVALIMTCVWLTLTLWRRNRGKTSWAKTATTLA